MLREPGAAIVIGGEAGIGKSALWRAALSARASEGWCVLRCRSTEAEAKLSFVALGDLLEPVLERMLVELEPPRRRALEVALMRRDGDASEPPDPRAIGLAVLGGLRALAAQMPVAIGVDDVQWLDRPSAAALSFALRRLEGGCVGLLSTRRIEPGSPAPTPVEALVGSDRVRRVRLGPLSLGAVHELIASRLGVNLTRARTARLHETCGGNPFFALEIARELAARDRREDGSAGGRAAGGDESLSAPLPVPDDVRALLSRRLARLPDRTRHVVLTASALTRPGLAVLRRAEADAEEALTPALEAGAITLDGDVLRFEHPLLASVLYGDAPPATRRRIHARLAEVLQDPEERARHLALAASAPSAAVARSLVVAARTARARGAPQAAAELTERAVELTPPASAQARAKRLLEGAELYFQAGDLERCEVMLTRLLAAAPRRGSRLAALRLLGAVRTEVSSCEAAIEVYEQALEHAGGDQSAAAELHQRLAWVLLLSHDAGAAELHAVQALALCEAADDGAQIAIATATAVLVGVVRGRGVDEPAVQRALALEAHASADGHWIWPDESPTLLHGVAQLWAGELERARPPIEAARRLADERGDTVSATTILAYLSPLATREGSVREGLALAAEMLELTVPLEPSSVRAGALFVHAMAAAAAGADSETRASVHEGLELARRTGNGYHEIGCLAALGSLELSRGNPEAAVGPLERAAALIERLEIEAPGVFLLGPDRVEALAALNRVQEAEAAAARWRARALATGRPWALALAGRADGIVIAARGDHDGAVRALRAALAEHDRQLRPLARARTQLALGTVLRQARSKRAAREALQAARDGFAECGAALWMQRAELELRRIGGRALAAEGSLSASEQSIAALVAEGRSNREVAELLHLSPRTVEWNLSRLYRKLGVRSRAGLAPALAAADRGGASADPRD